jgi:hypothetical protein
MRIKSGVDYCQQIQSMLFGKSASPEWKHFRPIGYLGEGGNAIVLRVQDVESPSVNGTADLKFVSISSEDSVYNVRKECVIQRKFAKLGVAVPIRGSCENIPKVEINNRLYACIVMDALEMSLINYLRLPHSKDEVEQLAYRIIHHLDVLETHHHAHKDSHINNIAIRFVPTNVPSSGGSEFMQLVAKPYWIDFGASDMHMYDWETDMTIFISSLHHTYLSAIPMQSMYTNLFQIESKHSSSNVGDDDDEVYKLQPNDFTSNEEYETWLEEVKEHRSQETMVSKQGEENLRSVLLTMHDVATKIRAHRIPLYKDM